MSKTTYNAFLARQIDSKLANELIDKKLTLSKLKIKSLDNLINLGITKEIAQNILKEQRPPIPSTTVIKLLYESKRTCCICRDNSKSIIIHHIKEWHKSKNHSEENLVVLCLEHHNEAHSKRGLSLNLNEKEIVTSKSNWIKQVENQDAISVLGLIMENYSRWDYFNHNRIFELFLDMDISNREFKTTFTVRQLGLINDLGTFPITDKKESQIYNFEDGYMLYFYMKELFNSILKRIPLIDLTDMYNRQDIKAIVNVGDYIAFQGGFYFKNLSDEWKGRNQRRKCYYKKDKIKIEFEFDAYEATSNSAWGSHLMGKRLITPVCFVKSIIEKDGELIIGASCLAIGAYFEISKKRQVKYYS